MKNASLLWLALLAGTANGQVVINEVCNDPPGDDEAWEYIELYGRPGMDLTGYAIALFNGGTDSNGDGIPGVLPEIDEAFNLDGLTLGANGFLTIYNDTAGVAPSMFFIDGDSTVATFNGTGFSTANDVPGKLENDGSSSFLLVRRRPGHSLDAMGNSVFGPEYVFHKDEYHDVDFDGKLDFGFETGLVGLNPNKVDPLQIVDDVAWSNSGGKEYVRSSQQELSDTPGFNPDAISRLFYYGSNPNLGHRVNSSNEVVSTRMADEEWVYGEIGVLPATPADPAPQYQDPAVDGGKGPTDPNGQLYSCPPSPASEMDCTPGAGMFLFDDIEIFDSSTGEGFGLTPGSFNDSLGYTQFRFGTADFDFDGAVGKSDLELASSLLGATLDDTADCTDPDTGAVLIDPDTGSAYQCYVYEGRAFNGLLMVLEMDEADGMGGENAEFVTEADVWAADGAIESAYICGDVNNDLALSPADFTAWLGLFSSGMPFDQRERADVNDDGAITPADFTAWLSAFSQGAAGPVCNVDAP